MPFCWNLWMTKERLHHKLVTFQREILSLSEALVQERKSCQDTAEGVFLELLAVLDAFENVFASLADKEKEFDKAAQRGMKSFRAIHRKVIRLLEEQGVVKIECADGEVLPMEYCCVVETSVLAGREEGSVLSIIKQGYRRGERVLRPAEVVTVARNSVAEDAG
jgi:molecular chaperone GrpE (heat shock protein)